MGIDYSFRILVHRRDAGRLLAGVATLCDRREDELTTVELPDGTSTVLPGTYGFKPGRTVELAEAVASHGTFDLALWLPQDGPLLKHARARLPDADITRTGPDGAPQVMVALVYLMVSDGGALLPGHWVFDFTPATSDQSRVFLSSSSIRRTFAALSLSTGAPLCLLDVEQRFAIVVTAGDREVSTQVPGPCVLWDRAGDAREAYRELLTTPSRWIIGPGHEDYAGFVESLARTSRVTGAVI